MHPLPKPGIYSRQEALPVVQQPLRDEFRNAVLLPDLLLLSHLQRVLLRGDMVWREERGIAI